MMTMLSEPLEALRDQGVQNGVPWTHPRTLLEYEDFAAFLAGNDPLPHWRNARLQEIHQHRPQHQEDIIPGRRWQYGEDRTLSTPAEYLAERYRYFCRYYDRAGNPYAATRVDEHGLGHQYS